MTSLPERCSDAEFERRHEALRSELRKAGLDAALVFGTFQGWQNVFYLTNHWDLVSCYLIVPAESSPVLITGVFPHLAAVRQVSVVPDIRFGGTKSVDLIAEVLRQRNIDGGRIGLIEPDSFRMPGIPHKDMTLLKEALSQAAFVPATPALEAIRRRKSAEEAEILRACAELTDRAFQQVVDAIRPGVSESHLAHVIASAPGETVAVLVGSTSMTAPEVPNPSIRPTMREIRRGDVVLIELSKGGAGYAGQIHGMVSLGPPTDRYLEMHDLAEQAYRAISGVLRPGCPPQEVADAAGMIAKAGYAIGNPLTHGFGMGIEAGLHVGMPGSPAYWPPADFTFPAGASLTIEPNPCTADLTMGATAGGLVLVTESGCEELQKLSHEGFIVN